MKLFALVSLLFAVTAQAAIIGAPFSPEEDLRYDIIENAGSKVVMPQGSLKGEATHSGNSFISHHAKVKSLSVVHATGTGISTGIVIPANSIIERVFALVDTAMLPGAAGTKIQFGCVGAADLLAATDESGVAAGSIYGGLSVGSPTTMVYTSAGCTITYGISVGASTAGVIDLFVDYVVAK